MLGELEVCSLGHARMHAYLHAQDKQACRCLRMHACMRAHVFEIDTYIITYT